MINNKMLELLDKYNIVNYLVFIGLVGFINIKKVSMTVVALLALIGISLYLGKKLLFSREEKKFIILMVILPALYLSNMIIFGFDTHYLDRPFRMLLGVLVFIAIRELGISVKFVFLGLLIGLLYASILSYYELFVLEYERAHGFMAAIPFGNFALLMGCIGIGYLLINKEFELKFKIILGVLIFSFSLWVSIASGTRGGWLAIPFILFLVSYVYPFIKFYHRLLVVVTIVILLITAYFKVNFIKEKVDLAVSEAKSYFQTKNTSKDIFLGSVGTRLEMWRYGIEQFRKYPIFGKGFVRFDKELEIDINNKMVNYELKNHGHLHNDIINILAKTGIVGIIVYFIFYINLFLFFFRGMKEYLLDDKIRFFASVGAITILGMFIFSLTDSMFGTAAGITNYVFLISLAAGGMSHYVNKYNSGVKNG